MSVWGILHAISGKPEIWQKSFRDASPRFYGQVAKPTLAWATWLELPCQAKPTLACLIESEFSMTPSGALDGICFHESCYCKQERHFLFWQFRQENE